MNFLKSLFGGGFTEDMAINLITDLLKKAKEEKGTECIVLYMDEDKPTIVETKFNVMAKLEEASNRIKQLKTELENFESITEHPKPKKSTTKKDSQNG